MKIKAIMCAAIAALAFASCSQDDDVTTSVQPLESKVITFNPSVQNAAGTRSTPITPENYVTTMKDFAVFAVESGNEGSAGVHTVPNGGEVFMGKDVDGGMQDFVKITNDGSGNWNYANPAEKAFWPNNKWVSFYAFSPANADFHVSEDPGMNQYALIVNVPTNVELQKDVMFAKAIGKDEPFVHFEFRHLLSQVSFKAQTSNNDMEVEVKEVTMANIFMQGGGYFNNVSFPSLTEYGNPGNVSTILRSPVGFNKSSGIVSITDADGVAMLVPQSVGEGYREAWDPGTSTTSETENYFLAIQCKIKYKGKYIVGSDSEYGTIYQPFALNWEAGKKYVYTLDFNGGGYDENGNVIFRPISYRVSVTDWDATPGETVVNVN